jgi:SPP1 gp7 family putative phage head morphogenesis protein
MAARDDSTRPPAATARQRYASDGERRYDDLEAQIEQMLADAGIDPETATAATLASAIASWLASAQLANDLRPAQLGSASDWVDDAIETAYRDGITAARETLRDAGVALNRSNPAARLNQPRHARALNALRSDQRAAWRTLAADLEDEVRAAAREAVQQGASRDALANRIRDRVEKVGKHRAGLIGETEPARAFHRAMVEEYRLAGVTEVRVRWETMGDTRVCAECRAGSAASPYSLEQAESLIPHHPKCRCWIEPVTESMSGPRR